MKLQLFVHDVAHEADAVDRIDIEYIAVNLVLVNAFSQQQRNDFVNFGIVRIVRKAAGVGHHAGVNAGGALTRHVVETAQLVNQTEHEFAR